MYISDFKLVDILRDKMGEQEALMLVEYIETRVEDKYVEAREVFSTKEDLLKLELKIVETISKASADTQKMFSDSKELILEARAHSDKLFSESKMMNIDLQRQIAESKSEMIKWMFGMTISAAIAIIGTILTVMKMGGWGN